MSRVTVTFYDKTVRWETSYCFRSPADAYDFVHLCNKRNLECSVIEDSEIAWEATTAWENLKAFAEKVLG